MPSIQLPKQSFQKGFTLLEIFASVVVIGILAGISVPIYTQFRGKAESLGCAANLRGLYGGAAAYIQDNQRWPRIAKPPTTEGQPSDQPNSFESQWIAALKPYGVTTKAWRCPSLEREVRRRGKPGASEHVRIDYTPTSFGSGALAPYQWPSHPWFIERGAAHGGGPQIILTDGSVVTIEDLLRRGSQ